MDEMGKLNIALWACVGVIVAALIYHGFGVLQNPTQMEDFSSHPFFGVVGIWGFILELLQTAAIIIVLFILWGLRDAVWATGREE